MLHNLQSRVIKVAMPLDHRHCAVCLQDEEKLHQIGTELSDLKDVLVQRLEETINAVEGGFSAVKGHLWIGAEDSEAVAAALLPKLQKSQESLQQTLFELVTLELAVQRNADAVVLATLMPRCDVAAALIAAVCLAA